MGRGARGKKWRFTLLENEPGKTLRRGVLVGVGWEGWKRGSGHPVQTHIKRQLKKASSWCGKFQIYNNRALFVMGSICAWGSQWGGEREGQQQGESCGASLARWLRFIYLFSSFLASFLHCLVSDYFGVAIDLEWYPMIGPNASNFLDKTPLNYVTVLNKGQAQFQNTYLSRILGLLPSRAVWEGARDHISWEVTVSLPWPRPGQSPWELNLFIFD